MGEVEQLMRLTAAQRKYLSRRFCWLCEQQLNRIGCGAIYEPCTEEARCTRRANCLSKRATAAPAGAMPDAQGGEVKP